MNKRADKDHLLAEVLAEASPLDFRAAMLAETLRLARQRRQARQIRRVVGALVAISLLLVIVVQRFPKPVTISPPLAKTIVKPSYKLVLTQPLPASAVVSTRKFSANPLFATAETVVEISTVGDGFRVINDHQLLSLLSDKPAVLIRTGPHTEELVFANPEDQKKFLNY